MWQQCSRQCNCIGTSKTCFCTKNALAVESSTPFRASAFSFASSSLEPSASCLAISRRLVELHRCGDLVGGPGFGCVIHHSERESGRQRREAQVPARVVRVCTIGAILYCTFAVKSSLYTVVLYEFRERVLYEYSTRVQPTVLYSYICSDLGIFQTYAQQFLRV